MKKYINTRGSIYQDHADNWLLMIPANKLSSDAKIVWIVLKKIQDSSLGSMTDAKTWFEISGLKIDRVKECIKELENFGLAEEYFSTLSTAKKNLGYTVFLTNHFLMKKRYPTRSCPHDNMSFKNPSDKSNILDHSSIAVSIKQFKDGVRT